IACPKIFSDRLLFYIGDPKDAVIIKRLDKNVQFAFIGLKKRYELTIGRNIETRFLCISKKSFYRNHFRFYLLFASNQKQEKKNPQILFLYCAFQSVNLF